MLIDIHRHADDKGNADIVMRNLFHFNELEIEDNCWYSMGLHPWHVNKDTLQEDLLKVREAANHPRIIAIGEAGLDKSLITPLELQIEAFETQVKIAIEVNKPMIIHCVRAYNEILATKLRLKHNKSWIIHWFNASHEMADQLIKKNFYLSFGHMLFNNRSKAYNSFIHIPFDKLFLETDDADYTISEIYSRAAKLKNIQVEILEKHIEQNFIHCFEISI